MEKSQVPMCLIKLNRIQLVLKVNFATSLSSPPKILMDNPSVHTLQQCTDLITAHNLDEESVTITHQINGITAAAVRERKARGRC